MQYHRNKDIGLFKYKIKEKVDLFWFTSFSPSIPDCSHSGHFIARKRCGDSVTSWTEQRSV